MSTSLQETIYQLKACTLKRLIFLFYELEKPVVKQYLDNCPGNASYTLHETCDSFIDKLKKNKLHDPFLWMGFNCLKATDPLRGGSLLFTTKFPEIPRTHLINLGRMKG